MPGFQGFPGRVGTLLVLLHHINAHIKYCWQYSTVFHLEVWAIILKHQYSLPQKEGEVYVIMHPGTKEKLHYSPNTSGNQLQWSPLFCQISPDYTCGSLGIVIELHWLIQMLMGLQVYFMICTCFQNKVCTILLGRCICYFPYSYILIANFRRGASQGPRMYQNQSWLGGHGGVVQLELLQGLFQEEDVEGDLAELRGISCQWRLPCQCGYPDIAITTKTRIPECGFNIKKNTINHAKQNTIPTSVWAGWQDSIVYQTDFDYTLPVYRHWHHSNVLFLIKMLLINNQ